MLSYSEYKLKEANEPPTSGPAPSSAMPDPTTGSPPGSPPSLGGPPTSAPTGMGVSSPDLGMDMGMGSPTPTDSGQKPTALNLKFSNFWDVLEKMLKDK